MNYDIVKYPMKLKTEHPRFNYLVRTSRSFDYYLFMEFNDALDKARSLSLQNDVCFVSIYEPYFNNLTREFLAQDTFTIFKGEVKYDKHAKADLHLQFYINAGEWLNSDVELN